MLRLDFRSNVGNLGVVELGDPPPFVVRRVYWLSQTPATVVRGMHAHKSLQQVLIAIKGSARVVLDDGSTRTSYCLNTEEDPLHVGPGVWREISDFSSDCIILVLASSEYSAADYIHDYSEFLKWKQR